jgi:hypothetical protein
MKKFVQTVEVEGEGLLALMGERVTLFCERYIYTGKLTGVNDTCVLLEDAYIVYDTGSFDNPKWAQAEKLPKDWYVSRGKIESFGLLK